MDSILTFVSGSTGQIMSYTTALFSDFWILIALAVGIPLAFYVIRKVIGLVRTH
jgi:hypothetical protein